MEPNNSFSTLRGRCSEERVLATQGLSEQGSLSRGRSCTGSPRPPRRPEHPPPRLPSTRGGRCTRRLIARAELTNRLAPSQQAPAPAGTRSCRALGAGGAGEPAVGAQRRNTKRSRSGRGRNPRVPRPRRPELSFRCSEALLLRRAL